jgi:hypothetical protein
MQLTVVAAETRMSLEIYDIQISGDRFCIGNSVPVFFANYF